MRANWLCGRFCVQASSFENYIAEKAFTDRFVQQSLSKLQFGRDKFNKNQFFQNLSELVVAGGMFELIKEYPDIYSSFKYERKFGGKKDMDFSFYWKTHECDINIEVKCPDYDEEMDYYNKEGRIQT